MHLQNTGQNKLSHKAVWDLEPAIKLAYRRLGKQVGSQVCLGTPHIDKSMGGLIRQGRQWVYPDHPGLDADV